jgi:arsenite/tail-anchored protein-transporting ATPase
VRVLLFTGKGGVGKTSIAAATAVTAAAAGLRTLVMSTDPAHSLADALGVELGPDPTVIAPRLEAEQIDAQRRLEDNWRAIQSYLVTLLQWGGVGDLEAEELAVIPGLEEIFSLVDVKRHVGAGRYDLVVVDCAPTADTLRLLSLPDALGWYIERIFPVERKVARVIRPVLGRMTTMPLPEDQVFGTVDRLYRNLDEVRSILQDGATTSVRLVVNAERMVIAEARRIYTYLCLFGYHVDAVIVNRLLPDAVDDPYFDRWKVVQAEHLETVREGFAGLPVLTAPLFETEPIGADALGRLAATVYGAVPPETVLHTGDPMRFARDGDGWVLTLALPFIGKSDLDVLRRGEDLYVKVHSHTRSIQLPATLRRYDVESAVLHDGRLTVRFGPQDRLAAADLPR